MSLIYLVLPLLTFLLGYFIGGRAGYVLALTEITKYAMAQQRVRKEDLYPPKDHK